MSGIQFFVAEDNVDKIKSLLNAAYIRGLLGIGLAAEGYAKQKCPVDTGRLRQSITHQVNGGELAVYIGTNVFYAPYVEFGTGSHAEGGYGNPTIKGRKAHPFLRPAATDYTDKYNQIMKNSLEKG